MLNSAAEVPFYMVEQQINGSGTLRLASPEPCFSCGQPTRMLSIPFEAPAHLGCTELAWAIVLRGPQETS